MKERLVAAAGPIVGLALFVLAISILQRELAEYHTGDILEHLGAIPGRQIAVALVLTALGYLALTGYDALAFRWIRSPLLYPRIALASFIAYVFSHNVGLSFLGGKFDPVWEPRYLASPGGLALPLVLTHVSTLISGGVAGVVAR